VRWSHDEVRNHAALNALISSITANVTAEGNIHICVDTWLAINNGFHCVRGALRLVDGRQPL